MGAVSDLVATKATAVEKAAVKAEEHHKVVQAKLAIETPFKFTWTVKEKEGPLDIYVQVHSSSWSSQGSLIFDNITAFYLDSENKEVHLNLNLPYIITNPPIWVPDGTEQVDDGKGSLETIAKYKESLEDSLQFMIGRLVEKQKDRR